MREPPVARAASFALGSHPTFTGSLVGPEEPRGVLEVGYEIGCGIDMSTSNGVTSAGSAGITPSLGVSGPLGPLPTALSPVLSTPINGVITVGLKPGSSCRAGRQERVQGSRPLGDDQQLPRQDRRMRWPVVYPLICDADPTDRSVRRSAVLRRRHQSRLSTAIHGPRPSAELSRGCHQRAIRPSRSRVAPGGLHVTQRALHRCARTPPAVRCQSAQR